jgi:hypothetical protein
VVICILFNSNHICAHTFFLKYICLDGSHSASPVERLVKAAGVGDVSTMETVKAEFYQEARKKRTFNDNSEIAAAFTKLLDSIDPSTSLTARKLVCSLFVFQIEFELLLFEM